MYYVYKNTLLRLMDDVEKTVVSEDPDGYFSILHSTSIQQQYIR